MIKKLKIKEVDLDLNQPPRTSKNGKQYWFISIKTEEYGDRKLTSFVWAKDDAITKLQPNTEVALKVTENGQYLNFALASRFDQFEALTNNRFMEAFRDIKLVQKAVNDLAEGKKPYPQHVEAPNFNTDAPVKPQNVITSDDDINPDDIPF